MTFIGVNVTVERVEAYWNERLDKVIARFGTIAAAHLDIADTAELHRQLGEALAARAAARPEGNKDEDQDDGEDRPYDPDRAREIDRAAEAGAL